MAVIVLAQVIAGVGLHHVEDMVRGEELGAGSPGLQGLKQRVDAGRVDELLKERLDGVAVVLLQLVRQAVVIVCAGRRALRVGRLLNLLGGFLIFFIY